MYRDDAGSGCPTLCPRLGDQEIQVKEAETYSQSHMHWVVLKITWCFKKIQLVILTITSIFIANLWTRYYSVIKRGSSGSRVAEHIAAGTGLHLRDDLPVWHFWAVCGGQLQLQHQIPGGADAQRWWFLGNVICYMRNLWKHVRRPWYFHWGCWSVVTAFSASVSSSLLDSTFLWQSPHLLVSLLLLSFCCCSFQRLCKLWINSCSC